MREAVYLPELARTTFLKAKLEMHLGNGMEVKIAFKVARDLRARIPYAAHKSDATLVEADFDCLVTFFSR